MADEKGTGKHPHKDTAEPWPHRKESSGQEEQQSTQQSKSGQSGEQEEPGDLKEREYRDEQGNVHHHTRTSQEMKERKAS